MQVKWGISDLKRRLVYEAVEVPLEELAGILWKTRRTALYFRPRENDSAWWVAEGRASGRALQVLNSPIREGGGLQAYLRSEEYLRVVGRAHRRNIYEVKVTLPFWVVESVLVSQWHEVGIKKGPHHPRFVFKGEMLILPQKRVLDGQNREYGVILVERRK